MLDPNQPPSRPFAIAMSRMSREVAIGAAFSVAIVILVLFHRKKEHASIAALWLAIVLSFVSLLIRSRMDALVGSGALIPLAMSLCLQGKLPDDRYSGLILSLLPILASWRKMESHLDILRIEPTARHDPLTPMNDTKD